VAETNIYQDLIDDFHKEKTFLGPHSGFVWKNDAKHLLFQLSRAKFCAKLVEGLDRVLDVGCGDGTAMNLVAQVANKVVGIDIDNELMECNRLTNKRLANCSYACFDISERPMGEQFNAAYSLDVIEHIPKEKEDAFIKNICRSLVDEGFCIIGTPNIEADRYASERSRQGHINLKSHDALRKLMSGSFHNVFVFSMNDEVVHTGFSPMAHYFFALGCNKKK
jgi:2-polyprenyl-3-methyl-5-hydroxy-6-metoxy-1,4-benzoquinol methylase